jgi:hypothetical protein
MLARTIGILAVAIAAATSGAQQGAPRSMASLTGVVRYSAAREPTRQPRACALIPNGPSVFRWRCAEVDSAGSYRLDSLPLVRMEISIHCSTLYGGKRLSFDTIAFVQPTVVRHDWVVETAGCDPRLMRRLTGVFRGHYTPGFESSEFIPCSADAWFIPGDSLDSYPMKLMRRAWARWPTRADLKIAWPDAPRDSYGNPRYYVRWRGTVEGPGNYGHMGVSAFDFRVESVLELRAARPDDCR